MRPNFYGRASLLAGVIALLFAIGLVAAGRPAPALFIGVVGVCALAVGLVDHNARRAR